MAWAWQISGRVPVITTCGFRRKRPPVPIKGDHPSERSDEQWLMLVEVVGLVSLFLTFPKCIPRRRGCGSCGKPGRGWVGAHDFQGVWVGPGVGGRRPGAFHTPAASI